MEPVEANYNLSRWEEINDDAIAPVDVYHIINEKRTDGTLTVDNVSNLCRELARKLSDKVAKTDTTEILYFNYDSSVGNSYQQEKVLHEKYGHLIESLEEMRDCAGYLKQWRVILFTPNEKSNRPKG